MPDINTYINQSRQQGLADAQIRQNLLSAGWTEEQVNSALGVNLSNQQTISTPTPENNLSQKTPFGVKVVGFLLFLQGFFLVAGIGEYIVFEKDKNFTLKFGETLKAIFLNEGYSNASVLMFVIYAFTVILAVSVLFSIIFTSRNIFRLKSLAVRWSCIHVATSLIFGISMSAVLIYAFTKAEILVYMVMLPFQLAPFFFGMTGIIVSFIVLFYVWRLSKKGLLSDQGISSKSRPKLLLIIGLIILILPIMGGLIAGLSKQITPGKSKDKSSATQDQVQLALNDPSLLTEAQKLEAAKAPEGMVYVPEGEYLSGMKTEKEGEVYPYALKNIKLNSFYIDKYETTIEQFNDFIKLHPEWQRKNAGTKIIEGSVGELSNGKPQWYCREYSPCVEVNGVVMPLQVLSNYEWVSEVNENKKNLPVISGWYVSEAFCKSVGKRLPTSWEWEKAARGTDGRLHPWGNEENFSYTNFCNKECPLWFKDKRWEDGYAETAPVGSFPRDVSPYGVYDMSGNVSEWTSVWADVSRNYWRNVPEENPQGPNVGYQKVTEGGSYISADTPSGAPTSKRLSDISRGFSIEDYHDQVGFRCVADVK